MGIGNFLFGPSSEEQRQSEDTDRKLRALNEADYGKGGRIYNRIEEQQGAFAADEALQTVEGHLAEQERDTATAGQQVDDAFGQGLAEGAGNIRHAVDNTVFGTIKTLLSTIPVTVWIAAVIVGFVYFGGWAFLSRKVFKRS